MPNTVSALRSTPTIEAVYQLHRNLRIGPEGNTTPARIANESRDCDAAPVTLSVEPDGTRYSVSVPSKKLRESYATWAAGS